MQHHAFVIAAGREAGIAAALAHAKEVFGIDAHSSTAFGTGTNPDVAVLEYGLLAVEDARAVFARASGAPLRGAHTVVVIAADRAYHEAQNALLKLFEEPPPGAVLYLVLPTLGGLLPTLRSRVHALPAPASVAQKSADRTKFGISITAQEFLKGSQEKRAALIKKLTSGKDEDARRENRDEAIALINGIERALYDVGFTKPHMGELLGEISTLRGYLFERSAPVKQILEHLALVVPRSS